MRITVQASRRLNTEWLSKQEQTLLNRELLNMLNLSCSPSKIWFKTVDNNISVNWWYWELSYEENLIFSHLLDKNLLPADLSYYTHAVCHCCGVTVQFQSFHSQDWSLSL